jgi:hypothetical protein
VEDIDERAMRAGEEVEKATSVGNTSIRKLLSIFSDSKPRGPRVIYSVRDVYQNPKMSQWILDLLMRTGLNFGNWMMSVGVGLYRGYLAFHASRCRFRDEARRRPPIFVTDSKAKRDLAYLFSTNQVVWKD